MKIARQIKKIIAENISQDCEICGAPLKFFISHREQFGITPLHMTIRVSCPACEKTLDQLAGIDEFAGYNERHLAGGGTMHAGPAIIEI